MNRWFRALVALAMVIGTAQAACLTDAQAAAFAEAMQARQPAANPEVRTEADAACTRGKITALLETRMGPLAGYKAGLTNPAVQQRFNHDQPVWGKLYQRMLLPGGSEVEAAFGARPLYEADMLVRVRSAAVNQARTPQDVLDAIDQIIPFIELPDLVVQAPPRLDGLAIGAINVGARLGVVGQPIPVPAYRGERHAMLRALGDMQVRLTDAGGTVLGGGKGSDILDHPLNAVVWLAGALAKEGLALKPGDLVSLGSFSPLLPSRPGLAVTATYYGLPGAQPVSVRFK